MLFCQSQKCCGHVMSAEQILDDIRRWPRDRMVGAPSSPRRRPREVTVITPSEKRAALAMVMAGDSVARVATTAGVSSMTIYNWLKDRRGYPSSLHEEPNA